MAKKSENAEIVSKSVSFNVLDPDQKADLEFVSKRKNFSAFCRMLIRMERLRQEGAIVPGIPAPADEEPEDGIGKSIDAGGWI